MTLHYAFVFVVRSMTEVVSSILLDVFKEHLYACLFTSPERYVYTPYYINSAHWDA